jgi:hypothetical protein
MLLSFIGLLHVSKQGFETCKSQKEGADILLSENCNKKQTQGGINSANQICLARYPCQPLQFL